MRSSANLALGSTAFTPIPLGAGGFVTGIGIAIDGTLVCCTDVYGSYVWPVGATRWRQLFTATSLPAGEFGPAMPNSYAGGYVDEGTGGYTVAIAPSNSNVIYATWNGYWWKSADQGLGWAKIGGPYNLRANTGDARLHGPKSIVDPQNPNVAVLGPGEGKLVYTLNGGTSVTALAVAGATNLPHIVAVDPTSAVSAGVKQRWAYSVWDGGVMESTSGPAGPYALLAGSPANVSSMMYDAAGNLWAVNRSESNPQGNLYKKPPGGAFARVNTGINGNWLNVAVNPANTSQIVCMKDDSYPSMSLDGGATWLGSWFELYPNGRGLSFMSTAIKWFGKKRGIKPFFPSGAVFHPSNGTIYVAQGVGVARSVPPGTFTEWVWADHSLGIETLETDDILVPPGGWPIVCVHDKGFFVIKDEKNWTNLQHFPRVGSTLEHGWSADYVPGQPTHLVGNCSFNNNSHGKSLDGGDTWTQFAGAHPSGGTIFGGQIVAASDNDYYWFPANNARAVETHDGGATWSFIAFAGLPASGESGWGFSLWNPQRPACSDKATGDVYAYNYGPASSPGIEGVWKRPAVGGGWTRRCGRIGTKLNSVNARLKCVPGNSGHLFFTGDGDTPLYRSTDDAATWAAVPNTANVKCCGFGKAIKDGAYPSVAFYGQLSGQWGMWVSDDNCATWRLAANYPGGNASGHPGAGAPGFNCLAGHPDVYGRWYIGTDHNGGLIGNYGYSLRVKGS